MCGQLLHLGCFTLQRGTLLLLYGHAALPLLSCMHALGGRLQPSNIGSLAVQVLTTRDSSHYQDTPPSSIGRLPGKSHTSADSCRAVQT